MVSEHPPKESVRPWIELGRLADDGNAAGLFEFFTSVTAGDAARALSHLDDAEVRRVLTTLDPGDAAYVLELLSLAQAVDAVETLEPGEAAEILQELPGDAEADIIQDLDEDDASAVLAALPAADAAAVRSLQRWDAESAGGLMIVEFVAARANDTVETIVTGIREGADGFRDYQIQYIYVLDENERLVGVLPLRELLLGRSDARASDLMIPDPLTVPADMGLSELEDTFDGVGFFGLPVVHEDRLVGVVRRASVHEALGDEAHLDHLKSQGIVGGEELRVMGLRTRATRRLSWLSINIGLNVLAASVIAAFQETLTQVIALAVFLPIISDMSGCSGNQAVAVSMRELSLGVARPRDAFYVWTKEVSVGAVNGIALGLLLGGLAWAWQGNPWLGLVAGAALALNTMIAVSIGGVVPLLLKGANVDPALASGPVLTTITDLCGFLLVLGLATAMLPLLV